MSKRKLVRTKEVSIAQTRLEALKTIDPDLDLGNGITVPHYEKILHLFNEKLSAYNKALERADELYNNAILALDDLKDMNEMMLTGIALKYGNASREYIMAGGRKRSDRKKPVRRA